MPRKLSNGWRAHRHQRLPLGDAQRLQIFRRECRADFRQRRKAQVGLIDSVLANGFVVGHARKRRLQLNAADGEGGVQEAFHHAEDRLLLRERHLQIDLRELGLAIGAQIFVAETARDLKIAIQPGDHEDLLEDLRRLRQREEIAGMHAARDEIIARALRRRCGENRRLDLQKALAREILPDGQRDGVAHLEIVLHLRPAQVEVAVLQAQLFVLDGFFGRREGRQLGVIEHQKLVGDDLDFAGRHLGIDHVFATQANFADGGDHVLGPDVLLPWRALRR